ncbi:DUF2169 family type VI secretion system accessory protein [Chondromyces apiculatus]|uniref:DUF2169 domain-containing protein n=1 Tax=Chondromyces apiculatus DSM 436 TaxID=1192034 RepID=A0A017SVX4_9BACT|nr:DUF2169 domain-containing protein [Chondromyces apiculatus]EYF01094.1 Hypothetical protein CAP_8652 [Chondromyces apiculatus DSM 436]
MIVRNYTRFWPFMFSGEDPEGRAFGVFVLRGAFTIHPGGVAALTPEQPQVAGADVFHGDRHTSSLRMEGDLAPFKPKTDIHVNATAHAPGGWPTPAWLVRARVGKVEKALRVTGPRRWVREGDAYRLTEPEPCAEVPIRYEHAFGGTFQDAWGERATFAQNPLGRGYVPEGKTPTDVTVEAPRIESPEAPVTELGQVLAPEGLGPIPRAWMPRRACAGTYDQAWREERWPRAPLDFDYRFYNSAHPDLVYPGYLRGNEVVVLENLHPDGQLAFTLPGYELGLIALLETGSRAVVPMLLDTLMIDVPEGRLYLTWRGVFSKRRPIRALEACMAAPGGGTRGR